METKLAWSCYEVTAWNNEIFIGDLRNLKSIINSRLSYNIKNSMNLLFRIGLHIVIAHH